MLNFQYRENGQLTRVRNNRKADTGAQEPIQLPRSPPTVYLKLRDKHLARPCLCLAAV
jgi:hypothetical protein